MEHIHFHFGLCGEWGRCLENENEAGVYIEVKTGDKTYITWRNNQWEWKASLCIKIEFLFLSKCMFKCLVVITTRKKACYNRKNHCNNNKVVAIRCYCNIEKVITSRCNKLRGNKSTQHKDLVAKNSTYCNKQVDAITSLLQQIIWWQ